MKKADWTCVWLTSTLLAVAEKPCGKIVTIYTTKQPQYLPKISDVSATAVALFEKGNSC